VLWAEQSEPWVGIVRLNRDLGNKTVGPEWPAGSGCRVGPVGLIGEMQLAANGIRN
ncbi:hypothetical protein Tco_1232785, partial [Tanacetum coccineum]